MKRSTDRLLTTHVGSLPRPAALLDMYAQTPRAAGFATLLSRLVGEVVDKQVKVGLDVVNDGEFGKPTIASEFGYGYGTWALYIRERLSGYQWVTNDRPVAHSKDRRAFSQFYGSEEVRLPPQNSEAAKAWMCTGPIKYVGYADLQRDIDNLRTALDGQAGAHEAFLPVVSPAAIALYCRNTFYRSAEEYTLALAEAMQHEYSRIADAGLLVQIDDPVLAVAWDWCSDLHQTIEEYRRFAEQHIATLNHALSRVPEEQIRYHLCWGSWQGPHSTDVPLGDIVDLMLKVRATGYSIEAANPRHEHEWRVWENTRLPDGKVLIPGVVTHKTAVLEHPETVADRLVRYAERVGRENVIAGTDCGLGGRIDPKLAWAKLEVLAEGAALATRRLWRTPGG